jgi:hypothetical protein
MFISSCFSNIKLLVLLQNLFKKEFDNVTVGRNPPYEQTQENEFYSTVLAEE